MLILLGLVLLKLNSRESEDTKTCSTNANRLDHLRPLLKEMKALNVYQINLIQTLKFMLKTKYGINPGIFLPKFREVDHQYLKRFSENSFYYKRSACKTTSFTITIRGPTIWNRFEANMKNLSSSVIIFKKN